MSKQLLKSKNCYIYVLQSVKILNKKIGEYACMYSIFTQVFHFVEHIREPVRYVEHLGIKMLKTCREVSSKR